MAISTRHTTSHANRKTGVRRFHREIICKRRKTINLVIFGNTIEIGMVLISDNSGASGSSGYGVHTVVRRRTLRRARALCMRARAGRAGASWAVLRGALPS